MSTRRFVLDTISQLRADMPNEVADVIAAVADVAFTTSDEERFRSVRNVVRFFFHVDIGHFFKQASDTVGQAESDERPAGQYLLMSRSTIPEDT